MDLAKLKVAIVHDWLPVIGGAELVLKEMLEVFPQADVYTMFDFLSDEDKRELGIDPARLHVSYLNKLPKVEKYYRKLLPFCPMAVENFDLYDYDLVLSSSHAVAKGVITGAHQAHVSYVHSPCRYAWDLTHKYLKQTGLDKGLKGFLAKKLLKDFRMWDYRTANGVDVFAANSEFIKKRIYKVYRRDAEVVYPPINLDRFTLCEEKGNYYLTASRMVPYKRIDLIAAAFKRMPECELRIIGDGPEMENIRKIVGNAPNIKLLGYQSNQAMVEQMRSAKAFVFAAEEDFGIVPVEAQACGTPVIAFGAGGALETVRHDADDLARSSGVFFERQTEESLTGAVKWFEENGHQIKPAACRANAEKFSIPAFHENLKQLVMKAIE